MSRRCQGSPGKVALPTSGKGAVWFSGCQPRHLYSWTPEVAFSMFRILELWAVEEKEEEEEEGQSREEAG